MSPRIRSLLSCALVLSLWACGARVKTGPGSEQALDALREEAKAHPNDAELWTSLLAHELFAPGGDAKRVKDTLEHVKSLKASPLRTRFMEAELSVLEGNPSLALDGYLDTLRLSQDSQDPIAAGLAEASLSSVSDMNDAVDDYRTRVDTTLDALASSAQKLGLTASHQLHMQRLGRALSRGDMAGAQREASDAGCVQAAQVAGAFGPRELLGFDQTFAGESKGALAPEYDLGPGRGKTKTRSLETRRCVLALGRGAHDAFPGTSLVRAELTVKRAGDNALRIESPNSVVVWVDGKEVVRLDTRSQQAYGVRYIPLNLSAGKHELRAKVTSRHPNPALSLSLVSASAAEVERTHVPEASGPLERYLAAKLLLSRGDAVSARELLRTARAAEPTSAVLVLEAAVSLADPLRPAELRRDQARDLLRKAAKRNENAWYPAVGLASLEAAEGHLKEAIDGLRAALKRWPEVIAIRTTLIDQLKERGWVEEADRLVADLGKRMPNACAVTALLLQSARNRGHMHELPALTDKAMACDATSNARFSMLRTERRYDAAKAELTRLYGLGDVMDEAQKLDADLELAMLAGDETQIASLRQKRSAFWADRPEPVLDRTDVLLSGGKRSDALAYLSSAIDKQPDDLFELRRTHEALGGQSMFAAYRKDGAEIIKNFEKSGRSYTEPQVLVLDYTVVRVFEDGSSTDLTHNIMRVQSQEAVDENGEFGVPEGARLLKLHTIKADGTRLEPEAINGKNTLSLPNLSPGDYVEFEFTRGESPSTGFPGGYLGDRFYFRSFEVPFDHSELVVILPPSMEPVLDPRGPAPKTIRETKDGNTVLRWVADESRPLSPEPMSVASREFLPSINLGVRVTWNAYIESLRDLLADKSPYDPAAFELVNEVLGDDKAAPASVRAARLFRWVTDQIEPTQDVFGVAPAMLAARTGSRERVLSYMLTLSGIASELALVRGADGDHSEARVPDPETFGYLLLRVQTEKGPVWVNTAARHAAFGYIPAHMRGEQAMLLNEQNERAETPRVALDAERRELDIDITLAKNGSAELHVRETLRGAQATGWRNDLDEVPEAQLDARFEESYVARILPGARLKKLTIEGRDEPEGALVLDFSFSVDQLGQRVGQEQRFGGLFASSLSPSLARTAERKSAQLVGTTLAADVTVRVHMPDGARVKALPPQAELSYAKQASFKSSSSASGQDVSVMRSLRLPVLRVAPSEYAAFSGFCRNVDLSEASEISVLLP